MGTGVTGKPRVLFYRYGSICEPDLIECFHVAGLSVAEEREMIIKSGVTAAMTAETVAARLAKERFLFVFTINFFPMISDVCNIHRIPYVCWTVDCPVMELFSASLSNECNRIFLFDRVQFERFRVKNPDRVFYLPLATNVERWDRVIRETSSSARARFSSDVSFVGSLYREYNVYRRISGFSEHTRGYMEGLAESQLRIYGYNFLEESLMTEVLENIRSSGPEAETRLFGGGEEALRYYIAHILIGYELAEKERTRLLNALAAVCSVDLYTHSDTSALSGVHVHDGIQTLTEMPVVFHESKVNLNITIRSIQSGLPLRIFDICGCGGFLMTNYQPELAEYYEPGVEAEYFTSQEELLDKTLYYLAHEEERAAIAQRGYERTKAEHTYVHRFNAMIKQVMSVI